MADRMYTHAEEIATLKALYRHINRSEEQQFDLPCICDYDGEIHNQRCVELRKAMQRAEIMIRPDAAVEGAKA